jgi:hypothetical protein
VSSLDARGLSRHDVRVAISVGSLVERFYGELWNQWNDTVVEDPAGADGDDLVGQAWAERREPHRDVLLPGL